MGGGQPWPFCLKFDTPVRLLLTEGMAWRSTLSFDAESCLNRFCHLRNLQEYSRPDSTSSTFGENKSLEGVVNLNGLLNVCVSMRFPPLPPNSPLPYVPNLRYLKIFPPNSRSQTKVLNPIPVPQTLSFLLMSQRVPNLRQSQRSQTKVFNPVPQIFSFPLISQPLPNIHQSQNLIPNLALNLNSSLPA